MKITTTITQTRPRSQGDPDFGRFQVTLHPDRSDASNGSGREILGRRIGLYGDIVLVKTHDCGESGITTEGRIQPGGSFEPKGSA